MESGHSNGGLSNSVRTHFRLCRHHSLLAGMALPHVILLLDLATGVYLMRCDPALLERRMRFGPRAESRPRQKIIVAVIFAIFAALLIVPGLEHRFGWSQVPAAIVVLANLLIIAAFGFFLVVLRENTFAASTITVEAGQRVISTGPYPHVRCTRGAPPWSFSQCLSRWVPSGGCCPRRWQSRF